MADPLPIDPGPFVGQELLARALNFWDTQFFNTLLDIAVASGIMPSSCAVCRSRRPKRFCPALREDICPKCCAEQREESIRCPLDCQFLQQAREFDRISEVAPQNLAFPDIQLPEQFTQRQAPLLSFVAMVISEGLQRIDGIVDSDARTALASLAETYRTRQSGIIYESKPNNPIAAALFELFHLRVSEYTQAQAQQAGLPTVLEGHVFGTILFYLRLAQQLDNKRRYSRSFLDAVLGFLPPSPPPPNDQAPSLLL